MPTDLWLCYGFNITQRHSLKNLSLCSVQSEEGVAPQGVHRAEAAATLWSSAVLLLSQHRRGILNQGFSQQTNWLHAKAEQSESRLCVIKMDETHFEMHLRKPEQKQMDHHILRTF